MLDLSILTSCRQIYEEANMLLWTTNTFSFEESIPLRMFINGLHSTQRTKLTRMHINFARDLCSAYGWDVLLRPSFISKFNNLRILHVTISHQTFACVSPRFGPNILTPLTRMAMLPLKHVTVVIGHDRADAFSQLSGMSTAQKLGVAEGLRNKLLDPNGREVVVAEMKAKEAERKQEKEQEQAAKAARQALRPGARGWTSRLP